MATVFKRSRPDPKTGKKKKAAKWMMRYKDENNKWKDKSSGTTCKQTAQQIANKTENGALRVKNGLIDIRGEQYKKSLSEPISIHTKAFRDRLEARDLTQSYIATSCNEIQEFVDFCCIDNLMGFSVDNVNRFSADLQKQNKSNRTIQSKIRALKTFCKWSSETDKIPSNPISKIKPPSPEKDRRHQRRMMTKEEWDWLANNTANFAKRWNMTGPERNLL